MADWQQQLEQFKTDRVGAEKEISRAKNVYETEKAAGATPDRLGEINTWANQVRDASGIGIGNPEYGNAPDTASATPPGAKTMAAPAQATSSTTMQTMTAPQTAAKNGVSAPNINMPGYQNGSTVDLTKLYDAVGASKPTQQWTLEDLQKTLGASAQNGKTQDLSSLYTALGKKPGDTFTTDELKGAITKAGNAASPVAVQASKYQDPAQFQALISQMNNVLAPLTQAQQGAAQTAYGQASNQLANKWAANGLLASGGAMAQQQQGANALAGQMSAIEAQQQANAIPLAQQFANLSLAEDQQKFNQNANNRDFTQNQAQQNVSNLYNALGQQQGQQNAWMQQAQNINQMDMSQNQWAQQFGAQNKQNDTNNMLSSLGLQQNMLQDYLKNYMGTTGMDIGQNQWSQEFGLQKQAQDFAQQMAMSNINTDTQKFNANLGQQQNQQAQQQGQFNSNLNLDYLKTALGQNQFDQKLALDNKQANGDMALKLSQLFGTAVDPKTDWGNMFSQVQGQNTSQAQNNVMDFLSKMAQGQPFMPNGMGNVAGQNSNYSSLQDFLNQMGGAPSQSTYNQANQLDFEKSKQAEDMGYKWANYAVDKDYKEYLQSQGISERQAQDNTNGMIADLMSAPDEGTVQKWLNDPQTVARAKAEGVNMKAIQDVYNSKYGKAPTQGNGTDNQKLLKDAYSSASKLLANDVTYATADSTTKQKMLDDAVNQYMSRFQSSGGQAGNQ